MGSRVRSNLADVFVVTVGDKPDYMAIASIVSTPSNHTIFTVTSAAALTAQLRVLVHAISKGGNAIKTKKLKYADCD